MELERRIITSNASNPRSTGEAFRGLSSLTPYGNHSPIGLWALIIASQGLLEWGEMDWLESKEETTLSLDGQSQSDPVEPMTTTCIAAPYPRPAPSSYDKTSRGLSALVLTLAWSVRSLDW